MISGIAVAAGALLFGVALAVHAARITPGRPFGEPLPPRSRVVNSTLRSHNSGWTRAVVVGCGIVVIGLVTPPVAGIVALVMFVVFLRRRRNARRQSPQTHGSSLAEVIDLFAVALNGGHNVSSATVQVSRWIKGDLGEAFRWCNQQVDQGHRLADVLERIPDRVGDHVRPLTAALVANERYGAPISASLAQLAADVRASRRRGAEAAARRLPVAMLFPLVLCVLPAFLLLTVVPVLVDTLSAFRFEDF